METQIQTKDKFTLVLYGPYGPYRCFELGKKSVKALLLAIPTVALLSILIIALIYSYFVHFHPLAAPEIQARKTTPLKNISAKFETKIETLSKENKNLLKKIQSSDKAGIALGLFPAKFKTYKPSINIENIKLIRSSQNSKLMNLSFNLESLTNVDEEEVNKISGSLFIIHSNANKMEFYPSQVNFNMNNENLLNYSEGESVYFSRLRPVKATFEIDTKIKKAYQFVVLVFSRSGEIILKKNLSLNIQ